jgi:ATP-binding cassette subfamily A (ABC1) protein 3
MTDAVAFSVGLLFPVANLFRAMAAGLNIWAVGCRNDAVISNPSSIYAYGGPILLLCLQVLYLFTALLWLDGHHWSFRGLWRKHVAKQTKSDEVGIEMAPLGANPQSDDLLRMVHVCKAFKNKVVVDDVSFGLGKSEIFGTYFSITSSWLEGSCPQNSTSWTQWGRQDYCHEHDARGDPS